MSISELFVDQSILGQPWTEKLLSRWDGDAISVENAAIVFDHVSAAPDPVRKGKETLFISRNRGPFIKKCPGTRTYCCCDYQILHIGTFCTMDCAYCILQTYFHPPVLQLFANHDDMLSELRRHFSQRDITRIGTGEFTDSLIWDVWADLSGLLVPAFAEQDHTVLELKTKTTAVDRLKELSHNHKTIVAWSLNTEKVIHEEERGTASLAARLEAARRCASWGYPLAFHFDPMVIYEGCENDYRETVRRLFSVISPDRIVWISLGACRFTPPLKPIIQRRFPQSRLVYGEFISGLDGKMRYFKPLRIELFRRMAGWIREMAPHTLVYFCMEDEEVWKKALGFTPSERGGLPGMLDRSAADHCGITL